MSETNTAETPPAAASPAATPITRSHLPEMQGISAELRHGRSVRDGYVRGWGLEFGDLATKIAADPLYLEAMEIAHGRTLVGEARRMNLFLLLKFYLPEVGPGNIIEFGAYKAGNAAFMAHVASRVMPGTQVYALDTFTGMPPTDHSVDAHSGGDFGDVDIESIRSFIAEKGLENLHLVKGRFEDTARNVASRHGSFALAHIDCDIYSAVTCAYDAVKRAMVPGGYIVFDDATTSSCIGATEAVEQLVIRRDNLSSEQIYPHFVFRSP